MILSHVKTGEQKRSQFAFLFSISWKAQKIFYSFTCILPDCVAHEISNFFFKTLWLFHEPHNQVRFRWKNKIFSYLLPNRKIVKQIVTFFAPQSLVHYKFLTVSPTPGGMKFLLSRYFLTFLQFHQEQELMNKEIRKWESSQNKMSLSYKLEGFLSRIKDLPSF